MRDKIGFTLRNDVLFGFELYVFTQGPNERYSVVTEYITKAVEDDGTTTFARPLHLDKSAIQDLLDQIIRAGFVPSDGVGSPAQVAAMQEHINDLRRMVFDAKPE